MWAAKTGCTLGETVGGAGSVSRIVKVAWMGAVRVTESVGLPMKSLTVLFPFWTWSSKIGIWTGMTFGPPSVKVTFSAIDCN